QWTLEDELEQENKLLSVEEAEGPRPPAPDPRDEEDVWAVLRMRQERRQRRREALSRSRRRQGSRPRHPRSRCSRRQAGDNPERGSAEEGGLAGRAPAGSEKPSVAKTLALDPETLSPSKCSVSQKIAVLEERAVSEKRAVPDKASVSEKRTVSEKGTIFEKTPAPETQPAPGRAMAPARPQARVHPASAERPSSPGGQQGAGPEKEPESSAGPLPRAGGLPPVTLQVRAPSTDAEAEVPSPTRASPTFSSSLRTPIPAPPPSDEPPRDSSEPALRSSAGVRLKVSSVKLGLKLERYHVAIQRSESVKCASPSHIEFLVPHVDVASKRHLFDKELVGQSREGPASGRKENLQFSRVVLSWLNQTPAQTDQFLKGNKLTRLRIETDKQCYRKFKLSHSVVSDSLRPHELHRARPPSEFLV
ncbi:hypothetical protein FD755_015493, partial [Muntiacus reevesi]